ncbi:MAG: DEAD/DEAH box helicase family protein [Gammaproteobacteria bacterium]
MRDFQVESPIVNSPYDEPRWHWKIHEDRPAEKLPGRRMPIYWYRPSRNATSSAEREDIGIQIELKLVSLIRERIALWRTSGYAGATRVTLELLAHWTRDGRAQPLFFAQREAVETIIFLTEARADLLQGIEVPPDEPADEAKARGLQAFRRRALKMATGSGKTTVMGMLIAWSMLNKVANRGDARYSDAVLVVCPNLTIRSRLAELDPRLGDASLYRTRDLVPVALMQDLMQGRVLVTNWHLFALQDQQHGARVVKTGVPRDERERIRIGEHKTTARGVRYLPLDEYRRLVMTGALDPIEEVTDEGGQLIEAAVRRTRYVESDAAWLKRVLFNDLGSKQNLLVLNDEAHHAYRIRSEEPDATEDDEFADDDEAETFFKEATVWMEGLDRIHQHRRVNLCVDLSATPYFLGRVSQQSGRPFPWVISSFDLTEAIESGLTKIPQLAVRDSSGQSIPGYFNIWRWILPKLSAQERGGRKGIAKPEAILRYACTPIAMLAALWDEVREQWQRDGEPRTPVFILVCKNTKLAEVVYRWLAEEQPPPGVPSARIPALLNRDGAVNTIRVDSKVVEETDSGEAKGDLDRWMRLTLDTVGKLEWPRDALGTTLYPDDFVALAERLGKPLHPPGRDIRCIVSVGMLTEGWDCNTVTHVVGLRPFMSQLLCEQVVGRALRRTNYEAAESGLLSEEVAQVFGVPFEIVPFKRNPGGERPPPIKTWRVHAVPERADKEIRFPRVEGYVSHATERLRFDWNSMPRIELRPGHVPPEVQMKAGLGVNLGRPTVFGPGSLSEASLAAWRADQRLQSLVFGAARDLAREYVRLHPSLPTSSRLFADFHLAVLKYLDEYIAPIPPNERIDVFLSPYYGRMMDALLSAAAVSEDSSELPLLERHRPDGSTWDVDYTTRREPYPVVNSHLNFVVPDTKAWEQQAAFQLDKHPAVGAFVKNAGLGFAIPYVKDGVRHDYLPDFVVKSRAEPSRHLIIEVKGFDENANVKEQAAVRWIAAVNRHGGYGSWSYMRARNEGQIVDCLNGFGSTDRLNQM